ncbi:MAG: restriction endonuclease subunit S [Streptococcus sp.]|nr:restriction endonuclease subunit S [Streptococcus sp.]
MTKIEKMIQELCPNGVEWKTVQDVSKKITSGGTPSKLHSSYYGGAIPWLRTQEVNFKEIYTTELTITEEGLANSSAKWISKNSIIVAMYGATAGKVGIAKIPLTTNQACCNIETDEVQVMYRYVYHWLSYNYEYLKSMGQGSQSNINAGMIKSFKIPIPPVEIQQEIVQILDKFTDYVTELTTELTQRQKQYTYYRDKLLSFENEVYQVEWKELGEVVDYEQPTKYIVNSKEYNCEYSTPVLTAGQSFILGYTDETEGIYVASNDKPVIIFDDFTTASKWVDFDFKVKSSAIKILTVKETFTDSILIRYLWHCLGIITYKPVQHGRQWIGTYSKIKIPIPPLDIQKRIVQVLDNFDAVCNDLNIGLPKEIELRQKQYEYFRDKLLTFTAEGVYPDSGQWTVDWAQSDLIKLLQWVFGPIRVQLGAICNFTRGNGLQKKDFTEEGFPVIHYGQIYTSYGFSTNKTISFTDKGVFTKLKKAQPQNIIMATTSENVEDVGKAVVWEGIEEIGISGDAYIINTLQNARYLNYFFKSIHFQEQKERKVTGTKVIRINAKDMENFIITLPSLSDQHRIVSILDKFDKLTSDLSQGLPKEIALRQQQYEYFRDGLLDF